MHEAKNIGVLRLQEGSSSDDCRHPLLCLVPKMMVVKYLLHLNGHDSAHAHLIHLYALHGIDYNQSIEPPRKEKIGRVQLYFLAHKDVAIHLPRKAI